MFLHSDLSFNALSGSLERSHINLKYPALLAVHHNQLLGPIPEYLCQSVLQIMLQSIHLPPPSTCPPLPPAFLSTCPPFHLSPLPPAPPSTWPPFHLPPLPPAPLSTCLRVHLHALRQQRLFGGPLSVPALLQDASSSQWVWVWQGEQQGRTGAGGEGGGNGSAVAWLAVDGNGLGSEGVGQQRGAVECAVVCGTESGQGQCGGVGAGQCVVESGWPPSLSCSSASGYVAVSAASSANTTTCELPPPSLPGMFRQWLGLLPCSPSTVYPTLFAAFFSFTTTPFPLFTSLARPPFPLSSCSLPPFVRPPFPHSSAPLSSPRPLPSPLVPFLPPLVPHFPPSVPLISTPRPPPFPSLLTPSSPHPLSPP
ncbi:unnamed protein product [Closterium sp. NIES-64]|nr:unnamed protein product [Closterium sp. NIES-65]CAI5983952.1 unnamed protein product [Closterium sp. NIES-64]